MATTQLNEVTSNNAWMGYFSKGRNRDFEGKIKSLCDTFLHSEGFSSPTSVDQLREHFGFSAVPEDAVDIRDFVRDLEEKILPHSINTGAPNFIGHMAPRLPNFIQPLAELLTGLNQNQVKTETAKATTLYERHALCMLHNLFYRRPEEYYKETLNKGRSTLGVVTSGGTIANLTALTCARSASLAQFGDVEDEGFYSVLQKSGYERSVVICSKLGHYSIKKSLGLLGLGRENLITIGLDKHQRMDTAELKKVIECCHRKNWHIISIVAIAGTTECGSFDDIGEIYQLADQHNIHLHIDAAWGGALIFSEQYSALLAGIEQADSITLDGHKQLYLPVGVGFTLFKRPETAKKIEIEANYIIRKHSYDLGRINIEGSRPAMVIYLQAALQLLGRKGYGGIIDTTIRTAKKMADYIESCSDFELLSQPQANIFLYRYLPEALSHKKIFTRAENAKMDGLNICIQEAQGQLGNAFVSRTTIDLDGAGPIVALRVVIVNPLCTFKDCRNTLTEQRAIALGFLSDTAPKVG